MTKGYIPLGTTRSVLEDQKRVLNAQKMVPKSRHLGGFFVCSLEHLEHVTRGRPIDTARFMLEGDISIKTSESVQMLFVICLFWHRQYVVVNDLFKDDFGLKWISGLEQPVISTV